MRRGAAGLAPALVAALGLLAALTPSWTAADDAAKPPPKKPCEEVTKEVQYRGLAYQHAVTIKNTCDHALACTIKVSSNPEPLELKVAAKATESVVVNSGSAASEFSAEVACK